MARSYKGSALLGFSSAWWGGIVLSAIMFSDRVASRSPVFIRYMEATHRGDGLSNVRTSADHSKLAFQIVETQPDIEREGKMESDRSIR